MSAILCYRVFLFFNFLKNVSDSKVVLAYVFGQVCTPYA